MELWVAIRIRAGRSVGPSTGNGVGRDPLEVLDRLVADGAKRLHLVDLDAAEGSGDNRELLLALVRRAGLVAEAAGGVRSPESAAELFAGGTARVVVGTAALTAPETVGEMCSRWPGRVVCSLDYRVEPSGDGHKRREVLLNGRVERSGVTVEEAIGRVAALPLAAVVITDVSRDGTSAGPDLAAYESFLELCELPIIAAGGVASPADIARLSRLETTQRPLEGVVIGTALHSGRLSVAEAERAALGLTR